MIAKLRIIKWAWNFLWEPRVGLSSCPVDTVPANTSRFHLSAFCFLLETGIPGSGRSQRCLICRTCTPATVSARLGPHALEMLSQPTRQRVCCGGHGYLGTSPHLSPGTAPSCYPSTLPPPHILVFGLFPSVWVCLGHHLPSHSQIGRFSGSESFAEEGSWRTD